MATENKDNSKALDLALKISDRVNLIDAHLIDCKCELLEFASNEDNSFEVTGYTGYKIELEQNNIFVIVHFDLHTVNEDWKEIARIGADFILAYKADSLDGLTEDNYLQFAKYNGVFNAWPYWREFVNSMAARLNLPPLTLNVYRYGMDLPTESNLLEIAKKKLAKKKVAKKKLAKKKTSKKKVAKKVSR
ncbi:hypothetical protein ACFL3G_05875 [Planctomycetota bacterium]